MIDMTSTPPAAVIMGNPHVAPTDPLAILRAVTEYADNLEHDLGIPASAPDAPAMAAAWAALEAARLPAGREG